MHDLNTMARLNREAEEKESKRRDDHIRTVSIVLAREYNKHGAALVDTAGLNVAPSGFTVELAKHTLRVWDAKLAPSRVDLWLRGDAFDWSRIFSASLVHGTDGDNFILIQALLHFRDVELAVKRARDRDETRVFALHPSRRTFLQVGDFPNVT